MLKAGILIVALIPASGLRAETVRYVPRHDELVYTFAAHAPKKTLAPGDTLVTWTEDCFDGLVKRAQDLPSKVVPPGHDNPQTGPFFIKGAEPGDTLVVDLVSLEPARDYAISAAFPFFGALTATSTTALLHEPLPEMVWVYAVDRKAGTVLFKPADRGGGSGGVAIPMRPFLGCLATAPANGEARSTIVPDYFGGNMDTPEIRAGNRVYLPVSVPGALLMLGDGHLAQGGGEIIGAAVESALNVTLRVELIKKKTIAWPRIENDDYLMVVGSAKPLEDALRIAFKDLVVWVSERSGLDRMDAYQLVSQVAEAPVSQAVDPNYTVLAKFPKKFLPR
jgi:acetamidase/formamidase